MLNQKGIASILIISGIFVVAVLAGVFVYSQINADPAQQLPAQAPVSLLEKGGNKPDLIIEKIVYTNSAPRHDGLGMPVMSSGRHLDFTVTIKNVGTDDFKSGFYLFTSSTEDDLIINHMGGGYVNQEQKTIPVNGSIDIKISSTIDEATKNVRFAVNYQSDYDKKDLPLPIYDELSYENNFYELRVE